MTAQKPLKHGGDIPILPAKKKPEIVFKQRTEKLVAAIYKYAPRFDAADLKDALKLAGSLPKNWKDATDLNDRISGPLDVLEILVEFEKPDRDTILATILYTALLPKVGNWIDREQLRRIEERFGPQVRYIVEDTISLWSLHHLPAGTQKPKDNLRDFKLMGLLAARSSAGIKIRAANAYKNLHDYEGNTSREEREQAFRWAEVIADLAYLARAPRIRNAILNEIFRIRNPQKYAEIGRHTRTARILDETGTNIATIIKKDTSGKAITNEAGEEIREDVKVKLTPEDIENVREQMMEALGNELGALDNFAQDVRDKEPFSSEDKTERKVQNIDQLGDIWGGRTVVAQKYIDEHFPVYPQRQEKRNEKKKAASTETPGTDTKPSSPAQSACEKLYRAMSKKFGRLATDPLRKRLYQKLVVKDPHETEPGKDARFDNYYQNPKPSGYVGIQDTFFFIIKDKTTGVRKLVELEWQFVGEKDHENNTEGNPSHRRFKTGMFDHAVIINAWEICSNQIVDDHGHRPRVPYAAVYMPNNDIVIVKGTADDGCRGTAFLAQHLEELREQYPDIDSPQNVAALHIDNSDPLRGRDPDVALSPYERLRSGDRIVRVDLKSALEPGPT